MDYRVDAREQRHEALLRIVGRAMAQTAVRAIARTVAASHGDNVVAALQQRFNDVAADEAGRAGYHHFHSDPPVNLQPSLVALI